MCKLFAIYRLSISIYCLSHCWPQSWQASSWLWPTERGTDRQTYADHATSAAIGRVLCNASVKLLREETCSEVKVNVRESMESVLREEESLRWICEEKVVFQPGVGPSERNPVRTKASFDLMGHMFSSCWVSFWWDFVPAGPRFATCCLLIVIPIKDDTVAKNWVKN